MEDAPHVAGVLHAGEVVEQRRETRLARMGVDGGHHGRLRFSAAALIQRNPPVSSVI